jgi:hypothetical protein
MTDNYADYFDEIPEALRLKVDLRQIVKRLIDEEPMIGKAVEGGDRLSIFRGILRDLVGGQILREEAFRRTERDLPPKKSSYVDSHLVFSRDWAERLVRTELSRFYNQAVMEKLLAEDHKECFVQRSNSQDASSRYRCRCSRELVGQIHSLRTLYDRLVRCYRDNDRSDRYPKVPDHPYCTHTVVPLH